MSLSGKVVFITGGASGIGKECVVGLLKNNVQKIYIADVNAEIGKAVEKELNSLFSENRVRFVVCDITDAGRFEETIKQCVADCGRIDIFLNNAGVFESPKAIDVNLCGTLNGIELALKYMSKENEKRGGIIVNTISILGFIGWSAIPRYVASKHGLVGLTRAFSNKYSTTGVKLIGMCPGITRTPMYEECVKQNPETIEDLRRETGKSKQQGCEAVVDGLIEILNNGQNGSIWIIEGGETYEIEIPDYETLKKKK